MNSLISKNELDELPNIDNTSRVLNNTPKVIEKEKREGVYTKFAESISNNYNRKCEQNIKLKNLFFNRVIWFIIIIIIGAILSIIVALLCNIENTLSIVIMGFSSLLVTVIGLTTIIAKYLFSENEDENMKSLIETFIKHDDKNR